MLRLSFFAGSSLWVFGSIPVSFAAKICGSPVCLCAGLLWRLSYRVLTGVFPVNRIISVWGGGVIEPPKTPWVRQWCGYSIYMAKAVLEHLVRRVVTNCLEISFQMALPTVLTANRDNAMIM
jgi:hypothetical protein